MRHALPADADFSLYSPVSPGRVLQTPEEEDHTRILMAWALALALTVALGIGLQHAPWIGPTISIAGAEDVASLSPPTLLFGLLTLWLGLEWGYVGACASGTLLLWYAGLPGHVAALLSVFDALALVPLAVSFRVAPVPTSLRGPFAWAFFLLVSVLCALLGSTGEILRTLLLDGVMVDSLPAWHGGWVGPFCQLVFITGPLLWWLSPRVGRWKAERGLVSPWAPPDQALLGTSLLAGAALISLFMLGSRQMAGDALDLALGLGLPGQELPPAQVTQIRDAFGKLDIIPALSVSIMACAALSLYRLTVSWSTTARANADALRASEARMTALVDAIPDLVLRFRPDGTVLDLKDGLGLLGQGDRVGQSITEFWPSRVAHPLLGRAEDALAYGTSVVEFRLESEMGLREYEARIVATGKDDVVAIVRDVTQQRELVRLKAELVHSIGQNMRTPINSVQGALGLIRGGAAGPVPARVEQLINLAYRNTERLVTLSEEVANMAPRQTGDTSFFLEPVNLRTLVEASVAAARGAGRRTRAVVDLIARDEEAEVLGDPDRIGMVLDAILSNALKFSPSRGRVEVTLARLSEAWRVQVRDEGSGIPEAFRPQVFRMVGRGPDQPASSLARARDMVLQLGGRIGFESRVGKGSTFWFELPEISHAERDDQKPRGNKSKSSSNLAAASGRHMRKLLLDDDEDSSDSPSAPDPESKDVESNHHGTLPPAAGELPEHEDLPRRGR